MPMRNRGAVMLLGACLIAAPAAADGKKGQMPQFAGPEPLVPRAMPQAVPELPPEAVPVKPAAPRLVEPEASGLVIDITGFNGGVGAGVDGGYVGGGSTIIVVSRAPRFSGVLHARASKFTFGGVKRPHGRCC